VEIPMNVSPEQQRVVVLGTGGTIAGRADRVGDNVGYTAAQVTVNELLAAVPGCEGVAIDVEQVAQVDSKDMTLGVWQTLAQRLAFHLARPDVGAVVVTHGTDTLEETAFFLECVLEARKPVVLTCAMRPATALVPDGPQNLVDAMVLARHPGARGVLVVCAGKVHGACDVTKSHTYRLDAFDSGDAGPLAMVGEGQVRQFRAWPEPSVMLTRGATAWDRVMEAHELPRVVVLTSHADADALQVNALLDYSAAHPASAVRGMVVAGTGNGTVHARLEAALSRAQAQGVRVVRTTRCAAGPVIPYAGQVLTDVRQFSPVKARIALALELLGC
jgi:L-asparaginase